MARRARDRLLTRSGTESRLAGLVLVSTAPDSGWMPTFEAMCAADPLPEVAAATERYLSGSDDRIVDQSLWNDPRYRGRNIRHVVLDGGAHFLWIERPDAVGWAFAEFAAALG